jgi:cytochrome P450
VLGVRDRSMRDDFRRLIDAVLFYPFASARLRIGRRIQTPAATPQKLSELAAFLSSLPSPAVTTYYPELKTRSRWNLGTRRWFQHRDSLVAMLDRQIETTIAAPELGERDDILAMLVQARDEDGNALGREALINDLILLIGAGHETTAAAISWAVVLLAHNPRSLAEATRAVQENDDAYIAALVKEVLRFRPPIPVAAVRRFAEPAQIGTHLIPPETMILIDAWGLHHDPTLYPEPEAFRPERFLDGTPPSYGWLPFGGGAHRCIGAALAELEIGVAMKRILSLRTIAPAGRALPPPARRGVTIVPHAGGRVRLGRGVL